MLYYFLFVLLGRVFFCEFGPWDFSNVYICTVTNLKYELKVVGCFRIFFRFLANFICMGWQCYLPICQLIRIININGLFYISVISRNISLTSSPSEECLRRGLKKYFYFLPLDLKLCIIY